jgi:hypothetical protein
MTGLCRLGGAVVAVFAVVLVVGCGGGADNPTASVQVPSPDAIAACFRREGATAVYEKKERGVPFVNGLIRGADSVSAELTGDKESTDELMQRYEAEDLPTLVAFEALDGAAVGVISRNAPATKRIVLNCLE